MEKISTDGIQVNSWILPCVIETEDNKKQKQDIQLTMWDFAGQEIYYVTHQFFMSKRCIYILVW